MYFAIKLSALSKLSPTDFNSEFFTHALTHAQSNTYTNTCECARMQQVHTQTLTQRNTHTCATDKRGAYA